MQFQRCVLHCFCLATLFLFTGQTLAQSVEQETVRERPTLRATALPPDFIFDGMNDPTWWAATDSITNLITIEPQEGEDPEGQTIVKVFANQNEIVVAARCYDNEPDGIVSYSKSRDLKDDEGDLVMITAEDYLLIVFDTFQDGRSGYVFGVNPEGARIDGLVIDQGEDMNSNWDAIWEAKTSRDEVGWFVEIRIPIKSLSFKEDLSSWGFNVQRRVQRLQEVSRWSNPNLDYKVFQTSHAGSLTHLPNFDLGVGVSIRPSIVVRAGKPEPEDNDDISLDVTQKLGPNLSSALTINTDFAETEVDVRQVNITRFPLFFPEKRTFFLEGADIFEFGFGLDEEKLIPFFSRRIGLLGISEEDQLEIPINVGGKIIGRVGNTNLGALAVNTRKVDELEVTEDSTLNLSRSTMGAVRIKQNVLEESVLGMLATFGDQHGRSGAWSAGVDFVYRTSNFLGNKNFLFGIWGLLNDRSDLRGDKSAVGFKIDYPSDLLALNINSIRIGDGFDPSLGFMPRNNIHFWEFSAEYKPRPSWPFVRQMFYDVTGTLFNNRNNSKWESYNLLIKPVDWLLESGDQFEFGIELQGDRPPEIFEVSSGVDIRTGSYEWKRFIMGAQSAEKRKISGQIAWEFGDFYNGDLNTIKGRLALKPSALFTLEFTAERNTGKVKALPDDFEELLEALLEDDPEATLEDLGLFEKHFTEELFGVRFQLNISPDLQLSSLTQYDLESREIGSNNKLRWTFDPFGDIFIVYNHNLVRRDHRWNFVSNQLPIKIQYAWRF